MSAAAAVTLLGPQRQPRLAHVVESLGLAGPFATISAGWQERESDDGELSAQLGGEAVNLSLWSRMQDVFTRDPELAAADRERRATLDEMQELYLLGVGHAMEALLALYARRTALAAMAIADAEDVLRSLDDRHLTRVAAVHADFYDRWLPHERSVIAEHRAEVASLLSASSAVVITGGHVGALLSAMHLFNVGPALADRPVIAWSAGAMVLTERVVLFNDRATHAPAYPEVYDAGLGLVRGVVTLPGARARLTVSDHARMSTLARRFAPAACVPLDPGSRVPLTPSGELPPGAVVVRDDGTMGGRDD